MELLSGDVVKIDIDALKTLQIEVQDLKAAFFVKDYEGDKDHIEEYNDAVTGGGRKIEVEFNDGEIIVGYTLHYSPDKPGFFMVPADLKSNNERIFVIVSATKRITLL